MEFTVTKQQAFELSAFLTVPSKKFGTVSESRKIANIRTALDKVTHNYGNYYKTLAEQQQEVVKASQEAYNTYKSTSISVNENDVFPTPEDQQKKAVEMQTELNDKVKVFQDQAEEHKKTEGNKRITLILDANDWDYFKSFFEREAPQFQMWQDPQKLDEIAILVESQ